MDREQGEVVDTVVEYLRDSISVNLVGLRQSGRSHVARLVAERLREQGFAVVVVSGVAALRDRPLVALALAGIDVPPGGAASSISRTVAALSELLTPGRSVLVIDDADELDPASCGAVVAAHARQPFPVLSVTRSAGRRQPTSHTLTAELGPGVRVVLDPLDFDRLHRTLHSMLPGAVDSSLIARVATLSGGLPGLVEAIVDAGRRSGVIAEENAIWSADGDLWDGRLVQAVEPLLADLTEDELDVLTTLSCAGTVTVEQARETVPDHLFTRIDELGLLQVAETPAGPLVGVFPPLVAEHLRRSGVVVCWSEVRDDRSATATSLTPRLTLTSSRAAILNMRITEYWRAEVDSLRSTWKVDPSAENAVPLISALNAASAGPAELATVIDGTRLEDSDPRWGVRFVEWHAAYRALVFSDLDGARELLGSRRALLPVFASQLRAAEAIIQLLVGAIPGPELLAPAGPDEDPLGAEGLEMIRIATLVAEGRTVDALAALPAYAPTYPFYVENHRVVVGLARVIHGDFDGGVEWALHAMAAAEDGLNLGEIHAHAYVAALGLTFAGRVDDLDALLGPVLTLSGTTMLSEHYQIGVLGLASLSAGWRGRLDYGWSLSVQAETTGRRPGPFPGMVHGVTPLDGPDENWEEMGRRMWSAVDERLEKGYVAAGVALAVTATEIMPDAARAAGAVERARHTQSPFLVALGDYVEATAASDPDALAECAADLWDRGARLHSVKASVTRSLVLRMRGELDASIRQAEEAWEQATELGQARGLFFRLGMTVGLSAREREIALMIAKGTTVPDIAATLGLSARTVENYLFSAYRKLGSEGRDDLVRAVSTWAALV
ncbi:MAG: helix-turn-helix transcriptional regulator [Micrococcales bacterium]|nr:helix-turn-helix transcriptional regulator [Micrococcales bacterium]